MKKKIAYKCSNCGYISQGYFGKCPHCNKWNTLEEFDENNNSEKSHSQNKDAVILKNVDSKESSRVMTDIMEFNRVMGGGIVRDSVSILTAKPGAGKSTLLLQVANDLAKKGFVVLYASGEESQSQIKRRATRILDKLSENIWVSSTTFLDDVLEQIKTVDPDFIIIDSIQTFVLKEFNSRPGTPTQTMECAYKMVDIAKNSKRPRFVFMVGQMTKDDELAGVRSLEHLVDTVLVIEGESSEELRSLMATKNRYGSTGEMGFFTMTESGIKSLDNTSLYFCTLRQEDNSPPGSSLSVIREGTRPIILETEALTSKSFMPYPSRVGECIKREHLNTLISILEERANIRLMDKNVVIKTNGNIKLRDSASNLSIMMSIVSSNLNKPIINNKVFIADVGLTGELKNIPSLELRIKEAERMGFKEAYIADIKSINEDKFKGIKLIKIGHISQVIEKIFSWGKRLKK